MWGEARGQREHFPVPVALHSSRAALGLGGCRRPRCAGEVKPCPERDFVQVADFLLSWSELIANFQSSLFSPESWCFWQDPVLIFLRRSGFSSRCPCRLPALGLSLVSAPLQPRGVGKTPSQHGTASATTSLVPGRVRAARGGGPRAASHPAELRSPRGFPAGSVPLCHIPLACPSCLPAEVVGSDGYPRMTTSLSSPVQLQGLVWQPLCPSHMARGVSGHPGQGQGAVGLPHSSPHSHVLLAGSGTATLVLCSPSEPFPSRGSSHLTSLPGTARKILPREMPPQPGWHRQQVTPTHSPRGVRGWTSDCSHRVCTCLCACAGTEAGLCVFLKFSRCRERRLGGSGSDHGSVCPAVLPPAHSRASGFGPSQL